MSNTFKWTVEFEVDETWVADGFDLTDEQALDMLWSQISTAYRIEISAKVINRPRAASIARAQGYGRDTSKIKARRIDEGRTCF